MGNESGAIPRWRIRWHLAWQQLWKSNSTTVWPWPESVSPLRRAFPICKVPWALAVIICVKVLWKWADTLQGRTFFSCHPVKSQHAALSTGMRSHIAFHPLRLRDRGGPPSEILKFLELCTPPQPILGVLRIVWRMFWLSFYENKHLIRIHQDLRVFLKDRFHRKKMLWSRFNSLGIFYR